MYHCAMSVFGLCYWRKFRLTRCGLSVSIYTEVRAEEKRSTVESRKLVMAWLKHLNGFNEICVSQPILYANVSVKLRENVCQ